MVFQSGGASSALHTAPLRRLLAISFVSMALFFVPVSASLAGKSHTIRMTAEETSYDDGLGNKLLGYRMLSHIENGTDITARYSSQATIPGPTIVLEEGDTVNLTIENSIPGANTGVLAGISSQVSVHVHGVHYTINSDGTLEVINNVDDQGAGVGPAHTHTHYDYTWNVAPGTAGTWPYHDHNYESHNGAEHKGLFGAIIVNPAGASSLYAKEFVLYLTDDSFWGMEIDTNDSLRQKKHGVNPDLIAKKNSNVRFHLIALGTDIHEFSLTGYQWKDPGTENLINKVAIGPLEKHVFAVTAKNSALYADKNFTNKLLGMKGHLKISN